MTRPPVRMAPDWKPGPLLNTAGPDWWVGVLRTGPEGAAVEVDPDDRLTAASCRALTAALIQAAEILERLDP